MVDRKKALWSNRAMYFQRKHKVEARGRTQRPGVVAVFAQNSVKKELIAHAPIILGSLLALLLIIGRSAGSG